MRDYLESAKDGDYMLGAGPWAPYALVPALLAIGDELRGIRIALERAAAPVNYRPY